MTFESFYYKTTKNTSFLYVGGRWTLDVPFNNQIFVTSNSTVDLYTNNFFYPLLKDQALPLNKTFLGNFKFPDGELVDRDYASYIKYLGEGLLTTYHINSNTIVYFTGGQDITDLSTAFLEWYNTWAYTDEFKHYKSLYAPINRVIPSWVELLNFSKDLYSDTSMLLEGDRWEDSRESSFFSTIDFISTTDKIALHYVNPEIWVDLYTPEQAMFRYYDTVSDSIKFWTVEDLVIKNEISQIAKLIGKREEEVLAIFLKWINAPEGWQPLYFNYAGAESFEWVNDPRYSIEYVY
jgi:hypothetical protein